MEWNSKVVKKMKSLSRPEKKKKCVVKFNFPEKKKRRLLSNIYSRKKNFDSELLIKYNIRRCSVLLQPIEVPDCLIISEVQKTEGWSDAARISKRNDLALLKKHRIKHCSVLVSPQCPVKEFSIYHGTAFFHEMAQDISSQAQQMQRCRLQTDLKKSYKNTARAQCSTLHQDTFERKVKNDLESQERLEAFKKNRLNLINAVAVKKKRRITYNENESIIICGDPSAYRKALLSAKRIKVKLRNDAEAERLANNARSQSVKITKITQTEFREPVCKENSGVSGCDRDQTEYNDLNNTFSKSQSNGLEFTVGGNNISDEEEPEQFTTHHHMCSTPSSEPSPSKSDGNLYEDNHGNYNKESSKRDSTTELLSTNENVSMEEVNEDEESAMKIDSISKAERSTLTCNSNTDVNIKRGQAVTHDKEEELQSSVVNSDKL